MRGAPKSLRQVVEEAADGAGEPHKCRLSTTIATEAVRGEKAGIPVVVVGSAKNPTLLFEMREGEL